MMTSRLRRLPDWRLRFDALITERLTATGPLPVPLIRSWSYQINAPVRSEYLNDIVVSALTGSYRIGTGDIRIPLAGTYYFLKKTDVTIQDSSVGTWTAARIDQ